MPLRLRSAGGGSVQLNSPVALATDVSMEIPGYAGAQLLTNKTPGTVLQVIHEHFITPLSQSVTGNLTYIDIAGLSASITPRFSTSKILISVRWCGEFAAQSATYNTMWSVKRNGTVVGQPAQPGSLAIGLHPASISYWANDADSTMENVLFSYCDTPGVGTAITYQVCVNANESSTLYTNRCVNAATTGGYERGTSGITLMEIAG